MPWTVASAKTAFAAVAGDWDRLHLRRRDTQGGIDGALLAQQLAATAKGREQLCIHRRQGVVDAILILQPTTGGGWEAFPAGGADGILLTEDCPLDSLFPCLPNTARHIDLPDLDMVRRNPWQLPCRLSPSRGMRFYRSEGRAALATLTGTCRADDAISVSDRRTVHELSPDAILLFEAAEQHNVEAAVGWFANLHRAVFAADPGIHYFVACRGDQSVAALPLRLVRRGAIRQIESLANYYTSLYSPLLAPQAGAVELMSLIKAAAQEHRPAHVIRLWPMDPASPSYEALLAALRSAGWQPFRYFCFGNWFLKVTESWSDYLKQRDGQLRSTIRRMGKKFAAAGGTLEIVCGPMELESAIAAFNDVYAQSWKKPEPYPDFVPGLIRWLAAAGQLRLGIARHQGRPVAAQLWLVSHGKASIFKLAYDEVFAAYSPGTLLTAHLLEQVIARDRVREVDYLIGDDRHKQLWMSDRRERWGIVAYNPRTVVGLALLAREAIGRATRHLTRPTARHGTTRQDIMKWTILPIHQFPHHAAQWDALQGKANSVPFLESAFLEPLLEEFGTGKELLAFATSDGGARAAAILSPARPGLWQSFQPSQLPLGAWIAAPDIDLHVATQSLIRTLPGITFAVGLTQMDPLLNERPDDSPSLHTMDYISTAWVDIDQPYDSYWEGRGKNLKSNSRKQRSKLQSEGVAVTLECIRHPDQVAEAIATYGRLESSGWKGKDGTAVHPDNAQGRFYRKMLERFCALGRGRIYQYRFNNEVVAMDLCIDGEDRIVILKTAYDESYKTVSPSTLMRQDQFRELFGDPVLRRIEFYGKVMEWHSRWTDNSRGLYHLTAYRWRPLKRLHRQLKAWQQGNTSPTTS